MCARARGSREWRRRGGRGGCQRKERIVVARKRREKRLFPCSLFPDPQERKLELYLINTHPPPASLPTQPNNSTGQIMNLETQVMSIESMVDASSAFEAMNAGKEAFQEIQKTVNPDIVSDLVDDMEEHIANADDISDA